MGYYVRVLGTSNPDIHLDELISGMAADGLTGRLFLSEDETPECWTVIQVSDISDHVFMQIKRSAVIDGELGK